MERETFYFTVIVLYIVAIIGISYWRGRGVKDQEEFMVAGRSASAWLLVASLICTWIGAGSLIGGGGKAYRGGLSQLWMSAGAWLAIVLIFYLGPRVRRISQYTIQDILEMRYHPAARVLGSIAVVLGSTIIFAYQLKGLAFVLEHIFHVPAMLGIVITGVLILSFTSFAGLKSILAMDILNGTLIILAIAVGLPLMLSLVGNGDIGAGVTHVTETLPAEHFTLFGVHDFFWALGVFFPTFFLLLGESSIYQKFYSAKSGLSVKRAIVGFLVGVVILEVALTFFAITASSHPELHEWRERHDDFVAAAASGAGEAELDAKWDALNTSVVTVEEDRKPRPSDREAAVAKAGKLYKTRTDFVNLRAAFVLPLWAGALLLAGAMAIIFSTANSFMMAASTSFVRDIYQRFFRPDAKPRQIVWVQRITMVCMVGFAVSILTVFTTVWSMALAAYTIIGATITPVILAAFLWKRVTRAGGVASLAVSISVWAVMVALILTGTIDLDFDYIVYFAGGAGILTLIVVSLLTRPSPPEVIEPFIRYP